MEDPAPHATARPIPPAPLDPQIQEFLRRMASAGTGYPRRDTVPIAEAREIAEKVRAQWTAGGPAMARTRELRVPTRHGDIEARVHYPAERRLGGILLYLHGGGFALFSIDTHDRLMREYAERAGIAVIGINYTRAPEARFPQPLEESVDTVRWILANAAALEIDAAQVFIGGDSAGANLAVGACLTFRDAGLAPIAGMVLNYGGFGFGSPDSLQSPSMLRYGAGEHGLSLHMMLWFRSLYIDRSRVDPRLSPLEARLEGLPPAWLVITECDPLHDESVLMAQRLAEAGVQVHSRVYPGTVHSFLEAVSIADIAGEAFDDTARWLHNIAAGTAMPPASES